VYICKSLCRKLAFIIRSTLLKEEPSVRIYVSITMSANCTHPRTSIVPNVCIEVYQMDREFVKL